MEVRFERSRALDEVDTLLDLALELRHHGVERGFLVVAERAETVDGVDAVAA